MKGERKLIDQNGNLAKQKHFIHGPDSDVSRGKPHALVTDQPSYRPSLPERNVQYL